MQSIYFDFPEKGKSAESESSVLLGILSPMGNASTRPDFGVPLMPDILGMVAGHLYYFLTVLHPLAGGRNLLKTPLWVYPPTECFSLQFQCMKSSNPFLISLFANA